MQVPGLRVWAHVLGFPFSPTVHPVTCGSVFWACQALSRRLGHRGPCTFIMQPLAHRWWELSRVSPWLAAAQPAAQSSGSSALPSQACSDPPVSDSFQCGSHATSGARGPQTGAQAPQRSPRWRHGSAMSDPEAPHCAHCQGGSLACRGHVARQDLGQACTRPAQLSSLSDRGQEVLPASQ